MNLYHQSRIFKKFNHRRLIISALFSVFLLALLCFKFQPRWETNDDVFMAMIAHGFGNMERGSASLIFSNVLWGNIIRSLPKTFGFMPYSIATLSSVFLGLWGISFFLINLVGGYTVPFLLTAIVAIRPVLFPQFTLTAGLLSVAAIAGFYYWKDSSIRSVFLSSLGLLFLAYLIRKEEMVVVLVLSLPFLASTRMFQSEKFYRWSVLFFLGLLVVAEALNFLACQGREWEKFSQLEKVRFSITDTGRAKDLENRPDLLARFKFSINDLHLFENWFLGDPQIANPKIISELNKEVKKKGFNLSKITTGLDALRGFKKMNPLFYMAVFLFFLLPGILPIIVWLEVLLVVFYFGCSVGLERERVFIPLQYLLIVSTLILADLKNNRVKYFFTVALLLGGLVLEFRKYSNDSEFFRGRIEQIKLDFSQLPKEPLLVWGAALPVEDIYPVLDRTAWQSSIQLLTLGWGTWLPNSHSLRVFDRAGGFRAMFESPRGINLIAFERDMPMLEGYCKEHFNSKLINLAETKFKHFTLRRVRCASSE